MSRFGGVERALFIAGLVLVAALAVEIAVTATIDLELARAAVAGMVAEMLTGREGGIPVGLSGGVPPWMVWQIGVTQDIALFLLLYPIFLGAFKRHRGGSSFLMRRLRRIEDKAAQHRAWADRWGPLGIFAFMLIPFLVNGPMVGGILGRLAGIPTRRLLLPVVASTMIASAFWVLFFDAVLGVANSVHPWLGWIIAGGIFLLLLILGGVDYIREQREPSGSPEVVGLRDGRDSEE